MGERFPPKPGTASMCSNYRPYPEHFSRSRGTCQECGVAWQGFEVGCYFRCARAAIARATNTREDWR